MALKAAYSLEKNILETLKCETCKSYLSLYPIFLMKNGTSLCGRCTNKTLISEEGTRNTPFEALAKYFRFPCIFESEGCIESLFPEDVPEHELECSFKTICCPALCIWQGSRKLLLEHCQENHPEFILKDNELKIQKGAPYLYEEFSLINFDDELFSLKQKFDADAKVLTCSLFAYNVLNRGKEYDYEIIVSDRAYRKFHKFPPKSTKSFLPQNETIIVLEEVCKLLGDVSWVYLLVNINFCEQQNSTNKNSMNPSVVKHDLLSELECPVCFEYITPPIYQCGTGHSFCQTCKTQICTLCNSAVANTRNFALEKVAVLLVYPCKFNGYGCDFTAKNDQIKEHQRFCHYGPFDCPLNDYTDCQWKNARTKIYSHLQHNHRENLMKADIIIVAIPENYLNARDDNKCYIIQFSQQYFKLHYCYKYATKEFFWAMQFLGPTEECTKYQFEIDFVDNNCKGNRLLLRSYCTPLTPRADCFKENTTYGFFSLKLVQPFIGENLTYKVRILG